MGNRLCMYVWATVRALFMSNKSQIIHDPIISLAFPILYVPIIVCMDACMHVLGLPLALMRYKSDIVHVSLMIPLLVSLNINMQCKLVGNSQLCTMHESTEAHGAATKKKS